jgi:hypothetical protein
VCSCPALHEVEQFESKRRGAGHPTFPLMRRYRQPAGPVTRYYHMAKPRIIVTCPQTGVIVISNFAYEDVTGPNNKTVLFACACGETHRLLYAGKHGDLRNEPEPQRAS